MEFENNPLTRYVSILRDIQIFSILKFTLTIDTPNNEVTVTHALYALPTVLFKFFQVFPQFVPKYPIL